jgi:hypothetical protein
MKRMNVNFSDAYFKMISSNIKKGLFRQIGKGSGRAVYDLGNGQVVKVAKNNKGIAQNIEEYRVSRIDRSMLFARIYDISDDYRYLIMDKADSIGDISFVWDYFGVSSNKELFQVCRLRNISERYNLLIGDFGRAVNWGVIGSKPVIIDYGFTRRVRRKYY